MSCCSHTHKCSNFEFSPSKTPVSAAMLIQFDGFIFILHKAQANMWSKLTWKGLLQLREMWWFTEVGSWAGVLVMKESGQELFNILQPQVSLISGDTLEWPCHGQMALGNQGSGHQQMHPYLHPGPSSLLGATSLPSCCQLGSVQRFNSKPMI